MPQPPAPPEKVKVSEAPASAFDTDQAKLLIQLAQHKIDALRVDRQENLKSLTFYGAILVAFFALAKIEGLETLISRPTLLAFPMMGHVSFRGAFVFILLAGAVGAAIVWWHVKRLHLAELKITGDLPGILQSIAMTPSAVDTQTFYDQVQSIYVADKRDWRSWSPVFWNGYRLLIASVAAFVLLLGFAVATWQTAPKTPPTPVTAATCQCPSPPR